MEELHSIYSRTYNFVYLRAKSMLQKEDVIQQLVKEVYLLLATQEIREENLYQWLGKQTYMMGCEKQRKKKAREADCIELEKIGRIVENWSDREKTKEVIREVIDELPDMYQATLYAFYYDDLKIKELASVMECSIGVIVNRLNYIHKYLSKALEYYQEESNVRVQLSVEVICEALRDWSAENRLSANAAQNIYVSLCRELKCQPDLVCGQGELAGANQRMKKRDFDEIGFIYAELEMYSVKSRFDKKQLAIGTSIIGVLLIFMLVALFLGGKPDKEDKPENNQVSEEQGGESDADTNQETGTEGENDTDTQQPEDTSEYIFSNSDTVLLTREQLSTYSKEQLRLGRNEIFARHGMIFGAEDLKAYFTSKSWYNPSVSYDEFYNKVQMNEVEKANLNLIMEIEETKE